jgi:hypothetical protein
MRKLRTLEDLKIMGKKRKAEYLDYSDIDSMEPAGACPVCSFEIYRSSCKDRGFHEKVVICLNCKKSYAVCEKCGKITKIEPWMFLLALLCVECSKIMDRVAAKAYFHITEFDSYYVALDDLDGQWAHLAYND